MITNDRLEKKVAEAKAQEPANRREVLESRAYDIAHWIAAEARVAESLDRSVAPIESEGARRIVALASAHLTRELEEARERERRNLLLQEDVWPDPDPSGVEEMCDADGCNGVALHEIRFDDHAVAMLCSACYEGESRRTEGGSDEC